MRKFVLIINRYCLVELSLFQMLFVNENARIFFGAHKERATKVVENFGNEFKKANEVLWVLKRFCNAFGHGRKHLIANFAVGVGRDVQTKCQRVIVSEVIERLVKAVAENGWLFGRIEQRVLTAENVEKQIEHTFVGQQIFGIERAEIGKIKLTNEHFVAVKFGFV